MSNKNLEIICKKTVDLGQKLLEADVDEKYVQRLNEYNNFFGQALQIIKEKDIDATEREELQRLHEFHRKLEAKLQDDKQKLRAVIQSLNKGSSLRKKYYGGKKSPKAFDRKC
ncbi:hypothetical protein [Limisalsivibrio acetivorans]|uniref:hypothetical protein n=1 Tax=Limisalsivibrio acetivorans TaxID=1304888 RepID=UPI0003B6B534|nr:hypothetical protein [Limisalsivibrio acetivorans]